MVNGKWKMTINKKENRFERKKKNAREGNWPLTAFMAGSSNDDRQRLLPE